METNTNDLMYSYFDILFFVMIIFILVYFNHLIAYIQNHEMIISDITEQSKVDGLVAKQSCVEYIYL